MSNPQLESICGSIEASCTCTEAPGHEGPHVCNVDDCGGSWYYDEHGDFFVVRFPYISQEESDALVAKVNPKPKES